MNHLVTLVEGPGDVAAVPVLLRKLLSESQHYDWQPGDVMRVGELPMLRKKLAQYAEALRIKMNGGRCHGVLVLLDLDDGCPRNEAWALAAEFAAFGLPYPVGVVFAHREYEEWLVASLPTVAPQTPLLPSDLLRNYPAEGKRGVKEWPTAQMPYATIYKETIHQEEFTQYLDSTLAQECRSFRRLLNALQEILTHSATQVRGLATPQPITN